MNNQYTNNTYSNDMINLKELENVKDISDIEISAKDFSEIIKLSEEKHAPCKRGASLLVAMHPSRSNP